jgi:ubiquinol-cytochrome c reductase cytochrome b subunit/menaquinol-cytochrome c reductase cytochrome b subunit
MPRLPAPPLPKVLIPKPRRPGDGNGALTPAEAAQEAGLTVIDWLDERTSLTGVARWTLFRKVPRGTNWYYTLGTATLFAFLNQAVTGVFLAMYYRPDASGGAYESVRNINDNVWLGQLVHGMHKWGASVMIILIFLHMGRVFFFGAYKYPRELTWVIGVVLLILTLMMGLTGYLLPLDNRAYWATVVATNIQAGGPFVGPYIANFLVGGTDFNATTLSRFYAVHMLLIPGAIIALIGAHLYLVAKLGTTAPPWLKANHEPELTPQAEV